MAAATVNFQKKFVTGPVTMEFINCTASDTNTVETHMANPKYAIGVVNTDEAAQTVALNVGISGKTLTINQDSLSSAEVNVIVVGF